MATFLRPNFLALGVLLMLNCGLQAQQLGANFNEGLEEIDPTLINHSQVEWVRGFVNIPRYFLNIKDGEVTGHKPIAIRDFEPIKNFIDLKNPANYDKPIKTILSLKLDFKNRDGGVPDDNTDAMFHWMKAIELFLTEKNLGAHIDILVVGNEPMWETENADAEKLEVFLNKLIDMVYDMRASNPDWNYKIYTGALNRANELKNNPILKQVIKITKENNKVQGLDMHPHVKAVNIIENDLNFIRNTQAISKEVICTEISLVRLWDEHLNDLIGDWGSQNGYNPNLKLFEWLNLLMDNAAAGNPIDSGTFFGYFNSTSWYPKNWLLDVMDILCKYNIQAATYGIQKRLDNPPNYLETNSTAWLLNFVYNGALFGPAAEGKWNTNPLVYPNFKELLERQNPCNFSGIVNQVTPNVKIFPNPAENNLHIYLNSTQWDGILNIYSLNGILVHEGTISKQPINISHLQTGTYVLHLRPDDIMHKFTKQ